MTKHRNAVFVFCRLHNIASACNAGGSSSLPIRMNAAARLIQPLQWQLRTSKPSTVSCSTSQTHSARKHWYDKRSAQHSTRAAAAAPALSSRDPASHAPSPPLSPHDLRSKMWLSVTSLRLFTPPSLHQRLRTLAKRHRRCGKAFRVR